MVLFVVFVVVVVVFFFGFINIQTYCPFPAFFPLNDSLTVFPIQMHRQPKLSLT